jgi:hypothetical protein
MGHGYPKTVWRPIWEFEGGWYEWGWKSGYQNSATYCTDYVAAFRHMVSVIRSVMPEAKFAFNAADGTIMTPSNGAPGGWQACYPGDDDTDFVAIDTYDGLRSQKTPADARWQQDQVPGIASSQALALEHRKGWAVPEWAIGNMGDNPRYVKNMHDAAAAFMAHGLPDARLLELGRQEFWLCRLHEHRQEPAIVGRVREGLPSVGVSRPQFVSLCEGALRETIAVGRAEGVALPADAFDKVVGQVRSVSAGAQTPSFLVLEANTPIKNPIQ